jgi:hypothetical protein
VFGIKSLGITSGNFRIIKYSVIKIYLTKKKVMNSTIDTRERLIATSNGWSLLDFIPESALS